MTFLINISGLLDMIKIARPDSSLNFMNMAKTMDLTRLCIHMNNLVVFFFQSYTYQTYKEIQNKNMSTVNRKY